MSIKFNADEVFEMAEQLERNGEKYYRRAAQGVKDKKSQKFLLQLADMESQHLKTFSAMRAEVSAAAKEQTVWDPENEAVAYLRAMADSHVFNLSEDPAEALTGKESLNDIFSKAVQMERDSIVFYLGLRDLVPPKLGADKVDAIIEQEKGHIVALTRMLNSLK